MRVRVCRSVLSLGVFQVRRVAAFWEHQAGHAEQYRARGSLISYDDVDSSANSVSREPYVERIEISDMMDIGYRE